MPSLLRLSSSLLVSTVTCSIRSYSTPAVSKSNLSKLRRSTGYAFSLCRESLLQNGNDYTKALNWLKTEAVSRGWNTAGKLASRPLSHGLLGVMINRLNAVIVEVNCETDFVARNEQFQHLVVSAAEAIMGDITENPTKNTWSSSELIPLPSTGGQTLGDLTTNVIGSLGENMALRRAFSLSNGTLGADCGISEQPVSRLATYVHMSTAGATHSIRDVKFGKYAAAVRYRPAGDQPANAAWYERAHRLGTQMCQHIVGMNPKPGLLDLVSTSDDPDEEQCLLLQPFILDENIRVGEHLARNDMVLEQFIRVECGHDADGDEEAVGSTTQDVN